MILSQTPGLIIPGSGYGNMIDNSDFVAGGVPAITVATPVVSGTMISRRWRFFTGGGSPSCLITPFQPASIGGPTYGRSGIAIEVVSAGVGSDFGIQQRHWRPKAFTQDEWVLSFWYGNALQNPVTLSTQINFVGGVGGDPTLTATGRTTENTLTATSGAGYKQYTFRFQSSAAIRSWNQGDSTGYLRILLSVSPALETTHYFANVQLHRGLELPPYFPRERGLEEAIADAYYFASPDAYWAFARSPTDAANQCVIQVDYPTLMVATPVCSYTISSGTPTPSVNRRRFALTGVVDGGFMTDFIASAEP
jgi:hypothetical protein